MTGIDSYSVTPATNATADGGAINWAEGQPPSSVNNSSRQWMADERSRQNDLIWFQYGTGDQGAGNIAVPSVYSSGTAFTITGADVTLVYTAGRRVRAVGSSTGTIYGTIASSSYNSGNTKTTVNVSWDAGGSLSNETLTISLSQIPVTGTPVSSASIADYATGTWTPVDASGATLSFSAVSCRYEKIGNFVHAYGTFTYPATANGSSAIVGGLPIPIPNQNYAGLLPASAFTSSTTASLVLIATITSKNTSQFLFQANITGGANLTNAQLTGLQIIVNITYPAA